MSAFVRVKDKTTGDEYSARKPNLEKVDVIDKDAVHKGNGRPLPAKPKTSVAKQAPAKKSTTPTGGEPATQDPEEGSK